MATHAWFLQQRDKAMRQGAYQSSKGEREFVCSKMLDFCSCGPVPAGHPPFSKPAHLPAWGLETKTHCQLHDILFKRNGADDTAQRNAIHHQLVPTGPLQLWWPRIMIPPLRLLSSLGQHNLQLQLLTSRLTTSFCRHRRQNASRGTWLIRAVLHDIDEVVQPLHANNLEHQKESASVKKRMPRRYACWLPYKECSSGISRAMLMLNLPPPHRVDRRRKVLVGWLRPPRKRLAVTKWHQLVVHEGVCDLRDRPSLSSRTTQRPAPGPLMVSSAPPLHSASPVR